MILLTYDKFSVNLTMHTFVFQESFFSELMVSFTAFCQFLMLSYTVSFQIFILRCFLIMMNNKSSLRYLEAYDLYTKDYLQRLCNGEWGWMVGCRRELLKEARLQKETVPTGTMWSSILPAELVSVGYKGHWLWSSLLADGALLRQV